MMFVGEQPGDQEDQQGEPFVAGDPARRGLPDQCGEALQLGTARQAPHPQETRHARNQKRAAHGSKPPRRLRDADGGPEGGGRAHHEKSDNSRDLAPHVHYGRRNGTAVPQRGISMRKLVLTTSLLVFMGALAVAWLSSAAPGGPPIGDISLAEERRPGSGTRGLGVPPRQASTFPARSSLDAGVGSPAANTPESSLPVPDMTIASANPQRGGYAPNAFRRSSNGSSSFSSRSFRPSSGSSGGGGSSAPGMGGGGSVGGIGSSASAASPNGDQATTTTSFTTDSAKMPVFSSTPAPIPSAPRPPSSGGGGGDRVSTPAPSGGSFGGGGAAFGAPVAGIVAADPDTVLDTPPFAGGSPSPAATPEPTTMLLLGTGIAGLYRLRRYLE